MIKINPPLIKQNLTVAGNDRSVFLSVFMKKASGDFGRKLVEAFVSGNEEDFKKSWDEVTNTMLRSMRSRKKK